MDDKLSDARWTAVSQRDASLAGVFFYGVTTTRIYCRPDCSSRRPLRSHTVFFATPAEARDRVLERAVDVSLTPSSRPTPCSEP